MTRSNIARLGRSASRALRADGRGGSAIVRPLVPSRTRVISHRPVASSASFSTSSLRALPLSPDVLNRVKPAVITDAQYHELSDEYLDNLLSKFETAQDERDDLDVEYSAGVMNINIGALGTYVINRQPPNKQIWLSSPISGPKRFDYVIVSDGQDQKEGTGTGGWVYLRDGTTLNEILVGETGVDPEEPPLGSVDA
ncbi:hypothetical protein DL766_010608 [Monosporascus sp. MC13-8B]|uniref:ferroxidase n=1 Tax=Monosporascus cannonballus TaxID=155416 RepID=A0ABY0H3Q2_9PEZI|nr:hypothetical protein DL762_006149 [Monosporascus cannonballus]RYO90956.1 hypothetical protein DL763_005127 [Monosporascus cannonballus]RYP01967.1 hypothetical protein DL766_010608 [Monosporascus sp. MC13-8B]